mgnify:CR=1 FL=1
MARTDQLGYDRSFRTSQEALIELYALQLRDGQIFRMVSDSDFTGIIGFANAPFRASPIKANGFRWQTPGPVVRPSLDIQNPEDALVSAAHSGRIELATLQRITTFASELDAPHGEGGGSCFMPEDWPVNRYTRLDDTRLQIELAAVAGFEGKYLPARVMFSDFCQHRYRRYDAQTGRFDYRGSSCPYTDSRYFLNDGTPTGDPAQDSCSLRLNSGCKKRFAAALPFLGFPGLRR